MTEERLPLPELLARTGDGDFLRTVAEAVMQLLMEIDVEGMIGAVRHEHTLDRSAYRNGYRDRALNIGRHRRGDRPGASDTAPSRRYAGREQPADPGGAGDQRSE